MENIGFDDRAAVRRAKQENRAPLCPSADRVTHGSLKAPLEHRDFHSISSGDTTARPTRHQVLQYPMTDQPDNRRLVGGGAHNAGGGNNTHLLAVSLFQTGGGYLECRNKIYHIPCSGGN